MVAPFEKALLALKPGEISPVIETPFGYHVIYRPTYAELKDKIGTYLKDRPLAVAESTWIAKLNSSANIKVDKNAVITVRAVARNPLGFAKDNGTVAEYKGGTLTKARLADWISGIDPRAQVRQQLQSPQMPDSLIETFVKRLVQNELMLRQADSAKIVADTAEMANLYMQFRTALTGTWTQMNIDPSKLSDSAKSAGDREKLAGARVETYFDKLIKNEVPFVDIPYFVARALESKFPFSVNEPGLDKAVEKAKNVRASADSVRAKQGPPVPAGVPPMPASTPPADSAPKN
jgi:hypothetical protein